MRKIKSMAEIEKVRRRNNIILGLVMIFLLTASSLGYSLMSADTKNENKVSENGFDFVRHNGLWKVNIGEKSFLFRNLPSEIVNVKINLSGGLEKYSGQPLYFVNPGEGYNEILMNIRDYVLRYQEACLDTGDENLNASSMDSENLSLGANNKFSCKGNLPLKNCDSNLIIFEQGNDTRVYNEGGCVFISGDALRGSDAFLYRVLGIV